MTVAPVMSSNVITVKVMDICHVCARTETISHVGVAQEVVVGAVIVVIVVVAIAVEDEVAGSVSTVLTS